MIAINTWQGGLNQDISKTKYQNNNYLDALNMRLTTDEGQTTASLINVKGNSLSITFPNTRPVYKISVNFAGPYAAGTITINGQTSAGTFTPAADTTGQDIYDFIDADANLTHFGTLYNIAVGSNYVIIYSTNNTVSPSFTGSGLTIPLPIVPAENNLIPIGFTVLRDDIYIFTTPNTTKNPGGHDSSLSADATSTGQIFKLTYNEVNYTSSVTLIYNNYLDFSTYRNIPTTAALGRYENADTQRIYWTDFFNPLRSLNVVDPNAMALDPTLLSIAPPTDFTIPTLEEVNTGGSLDVAMYQLTYRLKNTGGAITNYSELSNPVYIVPTDEGTQTGGSGFHDYFGAVQGTITSKAIKWKLQDLDTDYDRIEFVVIKKEFLGSTPFIYQFADEPIPADGEMFITFSGSEDLTDIDVNDFNALSSAFTHCKTLVSKDNILFAGNIKNVISDIDYDARAFRAKTAGADDIYLTNNGVQAVYTSAQAQAFDETEDTINDYTSANAGFYKPNTAILGGAGANISYEFGTIAVRCDSVITIPSAATGPNFRHTNPEYAISDIINIDVKRIDNTNEYIYPMNTINDDIKYTYYSSLLKGYDRNEIYRFGIQFYDKQKNPMFVKWIGDIKMPDFDDVNPNSLYEDNTATIVGDFRLAFTAAKTGVLEGFVNQLFIEFTVAIPDSLTTQISGYSIVRVDRPVDDKTILATGLLTQTISDGGAVYLPDRQPAENGCPTLTVGFPTLNIDTQGTAGGEAPNDRILFDAPEFLLGGYPGYKTGDTLRIACRNIVDEARAVTIDGGAEPYNMYKYYNTDAYYSNTFTINEAGEVAFAGTYTFSTFATWVFYNYTRTTANTSDALGSKTLALGLASQVNFNAAFGCTNANRKKLIAQYVRTLSNQYGGNTYSSRSRNEYINCSHFRPVREYITASGTSDVFKVFGGDIFCQVYDNQKEIKNWGQTSRGQYTSGAGCTPALNVNKVSLTFFFPTLASHNTDLRHGTHVNKDLNDDTDSGAGGSETQDYNTIYSANNDFKKYFPKPSEFSLVEEFDNRVHFSGVKINGELTDSWGLFRANDFHDVEGIYGPINALQALGQSVMFFQDKAFGQLLINPVSTTTDASGTSIILGTGATIQAHSYISNSVGTRHQSSLIKSNTSLYWVDTNTKRVYTLSGNGAMALSEIKGLSAFFNSYLRGNVVTVDKPVYLNTLTGREGILGAFDSRYNEVIFTIHDYYTYVVGELDIEVERATTIAYNELTQSFTSFYSYTPYLYIWDNRFMASMETARYSTDPVTQQQRLWIHDRAAEYGKFYGTYYDSYIKYLVNQNPQQHKVFDNIHLQTEVQTFVNNVGTDTGSGGSPVHETFNKLRCLNDYQDTGTITLTPNTNIRRTHRYWKTYVPRHSGSSDYTTLSSRIRDFYMVTQLNFTNNGNKRIVLHDVLTEFRLTGTPIGA